MTPSIRRILCPVDFSQHSVRALQHALALGAWYRARVCILHVHPVLNPAQLLDRDRLAVELRNFVTAQTDGVVDVEWRLEESDDVRRAILGRVVAANADLVVMGTHGRSGFQRFLLGSIAERVMRSNSVPVLVVPPASRTAKMGEVCCERIICATDFSAGSTRALQYAAAMAARAKALLTVVHIVELPTDMQDDVSVDLTPYRTARFEHARGPLEAAIAPLRETCRIQPLVLAGQASTEILRLAEEQQADLLVMGVHGRGAVDRMVFGSVTERVVRRATCPVLTVSLQPFSC